MGAADLVNIIRHEVLKTYKNESNGFELATVVSPYPDLVIKIDNMKLELGRQDLIICQRLMPSTAIASLKSQPGTIREIGKQKLKDTNNISKSSGTLTARTTTQDGHSHSMESFELHDAAIELSHIEVSFEDVLKSGDRLLVQSIPGGQKYIIIDRVVE